MKLAHPQQQSEPADELLAQADRGDPDGILRLPTDRPAAAHVPEIPPQFLAPLDAAAATGLAPTGGEHKRDWSATLSLVHRAVAAVRTSEERALQLEAHSQELAQRAENERMLARARVISAEARAEEAEVRASDAETYARSIEARAREIEIDLQEALMRAKEAESRAQEAEAWLKRLHDALLDQVFSNQIEGFTRELPDAS